MSEDFWLSPGMISSNNNLGSFSCICSENGLYGHTMLAQHFYKPLRKVKTVNRHCITVYTWLTLPFNVT